MGKEPKKPKKRIGSLYSGHLAKPKKSALGFLLPISAYLKSSKLFGAPDPNVLERKIATDAENLHLLMDHYGIDRDHDDRWRILAFALARDHVPAFQFEQKRGRPKKEIDKLRVYTEVLTLSKEWGGRHSIDRAISLYQKSNHPGVPQKTVAGWFYNFREEGDKIMQEWEEEG